MTNLFFKTFSAVILILFFSGHKYVFADEIMSRPRKYESPYKNMDIRPGEPAATNGWNPWYVVVINENAQTTTAPDGAEKYTSLNFGEHFYVVAQDGNFLRIVRDPRPSDKKLSPEAEPMGWISKNDVLLWDVAIQNSENGFSIRALVNNKNIGVSIDNQDDFNITEAFRRPDLTGPAVSEHRSIEMFYYIYKYSSNHNTVLLGRGPSFNVNKLSSEGSLNTLIGWFDLDQVYEWKHRLAIEPNYEKAAAMERQRENIRTTVFSSSQDANGSKVCAENFLNGKEPGNDCIIIWDDDIYSKDGSFQRLNGYWRRFPIINSYDDAYEVMVMGDMQSRYGIIDHRVSANMRAQLNRLIEKKRNVNIVFALEGTDDMQPYIEAVVNSIEQVKDVFWQRAVDIKTLRFGYVVYRDYYDRDRLLEHMPLTWFCDQVMARLRHVKSPNRSDPYSHQAMYFGLRETFQNVFTDPDETNILIHVAGSGSHERYDPSYVPQEVIVDLMAEYGSFYIAYQSHHTQNHPAYRDFPIQVREIMKSASQAMFEKWALVGGHELFDEKPLLVTEDNISRIKNGIPMMLIDKPYGERFDPELLTDEITRAIFQIDHYNDAVIEALRKMLEKGSSFEVAIEKMNEKYSGSFAPGVLDALGRMDVGHEDLKHFYGENVELTSAGYAPRYHHKINSPLFRPVLLLNAREFNSIYNQVRRLERTMLGSGDLRQLLYNFLMDIMKYVDPETSLVEKFIELEDYKQLVRQSGSVLESILNTRDYEYSFIMNDTRYYWLCIDKLPLFIPVTQRHHFSPPMSWPY